MFWESSTTKANYINISIYEALAAPEERMGSYSIDTGYVINLFIGVTGSSIFYFHFYRKF